MKVVLVTGGRAYPDPAHVFRVLDEEQPDLVIHGGASTWLPEQRIRLGADYQAECWCNARTVAQLKVPYRSALGRAGGPVRNEQMVSLLDDFRQMGHDCRVVAFPGGTGTADTIVRARRWGFEIREEASQR